MIWKKKKKKRAESKLKLAYHTPLSVPFIIRQESRKGKVGEVCGDEGKTELEFTFS